MKRILTLLFLLLTISVQAQYARRFYYQDSNNLVIAKADGTTPVPYHRSTVSIVPLSNQIQVKVSGNTAVLFALTDFLDKTGTPYSTVSVSAALTAFTNSIPGSTSTQTTFDFYVSSLNGNDAYSGQSPATPKKTIGAAMALMSSGKSLGIERGSYFREQATVTTQNNLISAYGSGNKPVFDASDIVSAASITKTGGQTNVYQFQATPTTTGTETTTYPFTVFENGIRLVRVSSIANCDATPGSFYPSGGVSVGVAVTVYVHPTGNTNATSDGKTYEVVVRDQAFYSSSAATGLVLDGILCRRANANDGSLRINGTGSTIRNCTAEHGTKHTVYVTDNCLVENVIALGAENVDSYFIGYIQDGAGSQGITYRNCRAIGQYAFGTESTAFSGSVGWYAHTNTGTILKLTYEDCYAENLGTAFSGDAITTQLTRCRTILVGTAIATPTGAGKNTTATACFFDQRYGQAYQKTSNDNRTLLTCSTGTTNIQGCVFLINPTNGGEILYSVDAGAIINITNNTFVAQSGAASFLLFYKQGTGLVNLDRNIMYGFSELHQNYANSNHLISATNNLYYRTSGTFTWKDAGTSYTTFSAWQGSGQDAAGLNVDPQFTTPIANWTKVSDAVPGNSVVVSLKAGATF